MELTEHEKQYLHTTWSVANDRLVFLKEMLKEQEKRKAFIEKYMQDEEDLKKERDRLFQKFIEQEKASTLPPSNPHSSEEEKFQGMVGTGGTIYTGTVKWVAKDLNEIEKGLIT